MSEPTYDPKREYMLMAKDDPSDTTWVSGGRVASVLSQLGDKAIVALGQDNAPVARTPLPAGGAGRSMPRASKMPGWLRAGVNLLPVAGNVAGDVVGGAAGLATGPFAPAAVPTLAMGGGAAGSMTGEWLRQKALEGLGDPAMSPDESARAIQTQGVLGGVGAGAGRLLPWAARMLGGNLGEASMVLKPSTRAAFTPGATPLPAYGDVPDVVAHNLGNARLPVIRQGGGRALPSDALRAGMQPVVGQLRDVLDQAAQAGNTIKRARFTEAINRLIGQLGNQAGTEGDRAFLTSLRDNFVKQFPKDMSPQAVQTIKVASGKQAASLLDRMAVGGTTTANDAMATQYHKILSDVARGQLAGLPNYGDEIVRLNRVLEPDIVLRRALAASEVAPRMTWGGGPVGKAMAMSPLGDRTLMSQSALALTDPFVQAGLRNAPRVPVGFFPYTTTPQDQ